MKHAAGAFLRARAVRRDSLLPPLMLLLLVLVSERTSALTQTNEATAALKRKSREDVCRVAAPWLSAFSPPTTVATYAGVPSSFPLAAAPEQDTPMRCSTKALLPAAAKSQSVTRDALLAATNSSPLAVQGRPLFPAIPHTPAFSEDTAAVAPGRGAAAEKEMAPPDRTCPAAEQWLATGNELEEAAGGRAPVFPANKAISQAKRKVIEGGRTAETQTATESAKLAPERETPSPVTASTPTAQETDRRREQDELCASKEGSAGGKSRERENDLSRENTAVTPEEPPVAKEISSTFKREHNTREGNATRMQRKSSSRDSGESVVENATSRVNQATRGSSVYERKPAKEIHVDLSDEAIENERPSFFAREKWTKASLQYGFGALRPFCQLCLHALRRCVGTSAAAHSLFQSAGETQQADIPENLDAYADTAAVERDVAANAPGPIPGKRREDADSAGSSGSNSSSSVIRSIKAFGSSDIGGQSAGRSLYSVFPSSLLHNIAQESPSSPEGNKIASTTSSLTTTAHPVDTSTSLGGAVSEGGDALCQAVCGVSCGGLGASLTRQQKCSWCAADRGRCVAWKGCERDCKDDCFPKISDTRHDVERARRKRQRILQLYREGKLDEFLSTPWTKKHPRQNRRQKGGKQKARKKPQYSHKGHEEGRAHKKQQHLQPKEVAPQQKSTQQKAEQHRGLQSGTASQELNEQEWQQQKLPTTEEKHCQQGTPGRRQVKEKEFAMLSEHVQLPSGEQANRERRHRDALQAKTQDLKGEEEKRGIESNSYRHNGGKGSVEGEDGEEVGRGIQETGLTRRDTAKLVLRTGEWDRNQQTTEDDVEVVEDLKKKTGPEKSSSVGFVEEEVETGEREMLLRTETKKGRTANSRGSSKRQRRRESTASTEKLEKLLTHLLREEKDEKEAAEIARTKERKRRAAVEAIEKRNEELARRGRDPQQAGNASEKERKHQKKEGRNTKEEEEEEEEIQRLWMSPRQRQQHEAMDPQNIRAALYMKELE